MRQQDEEFEDAAFQTPILKICQALTAEVKAEDAEAGDFYNTLTEESYGNAIEFIVAHPQKGRSASLKDGRYRNLISEDIIPDDDFWSEVVGEAFVGTPFSEYEDAEEQYKRRVNAGEIEWGSGPKISTTYNYTGLVLPPGLEDDEEDPEPFPVRITFVRSTKKAHDKLQTLRKSLLRNKPWWDLSFKFQTTEQAFGRNTAYVVQVRKGRPTTPEEKQLAVQLALAANTGRTAANEDAGADKQVAPDAEGGLEV